MLLVDGQGRWWCDADQHLHLVDNDFERFVRQVVHLADHAASWRRRH
jgi:hypothetical protein